MLFSVILCFSIVSSTKTCFAQEAGVIFVRADGSIDPPTAPISTVGNVTYNLTADLGTEAVVIYRNNIIFDGNSHSLQGLKLANCDNVTITNATVAVDPYGFTGIAGIWVTNSSNINIHTNNATGCPTVVIDIQSSSCVSIHENNITNNLEAIKLEGTAKSSIYRNFIYVNRSHLATGYGIIISGLSNDNSIFENDIIGMDHGIEIFDSGENHIYHNNFIDNQEDPYVYNSTMQNF